MRLLLFPLLLLGCAAVIRAEDRPRPAAADENVLFKEAMQNAMQDTEHWAYTETTVIKTSKGKEPGETVVRFDPSRPYAEQFTPLKVQGKPPTERQLKDYRRRGEKRGERVNRAALAAADPAAPPHVAQARINGSSVTVDLEHPRVVRDEGDRLLFEVPLVATGQDFPVEKFEVQVVVNKLSRQVEHVTMRIRESFRMKLVAKIKAGEVRIDFTVVDPKFGPVMTSARGNFGASFLFIPVNGTFANTRTDWQRVKPYNDRLRVKLGPLEVLDF